MRDWAFGLMIGLIFMSFAGCTAIGYVAESNKIVELRKINAETEIRKYEIENKLENGK
jgi:hypothetical protein